MIVSIKAIDKLVIHGIGNKSNGSGIRFSNKTSVFNDIESYFIAQVQKAFKFEEFFQLYFTYDINLNPVYNFIDSLFNEKNNFIEVSQALAKHLYDQSTHPKIKDGELYIVSFKNCIVNGITTDAIGMFKSENKDTFLKVYPNDDSYKIECDKGINLNKLDKGCLIFNIEKENGYLVSVVDNTNKDVEAKYWIDDFLHIKPRKDEFYNTQNVLLLCKNFVTEELSEQTDISKADQVDFLNKSVEYFKKNENFDMATFAMEVIGKPEVIETFNQYKSDYEFARELAIMEKFTISESAVKKQARTIKSVIKLDKNFHIYIHGDREMIEQGTDNEGRKYYKIYYNVES
ncbi:MAG: nucleoid-associated protein [Sulfuricurvum sp.]|nr:nucleoid-associated protein [Sulfuricurvum sp.]